MLPRARMARVVPVGRRHPNPNGRLSLLRASRQCDGRVLGREQLRTIGERDVHKLADSSVGKEPQPGGRDCDRSAAYVRGQNQPDDLVLGRQQLWSTRQWYENQCKCPGAGNRDFRHHGDNRWLLPHLRSRRERSRAMLGLQWYGRTGEWHAHRFSTPVAVAGLSGISDVGAGEYHTCAITAAKSLECWGDDEAGQLGNGLFLNGPTYDSTVPVPVLSLGGTVATVSGGEYHTCALLTSGAVQCWGDNTFGQLGNGTHAGASLPTTIGGLTATAMTTGANHSCAVLSAGTIKCWGYNGTGGVGLGNLATVATLIPLHQISQLLIHRHERGGRNLQYLCRSTGRQRRLLGEQHRRSTRHWQHVADKLPVQRAGRERRHQSAYNIGRDFGDFQQREHWSCDDRLGQRHRDRRKQWKDDRESDVRLDLGDGSDYGDAVEVCSRGSVVPSARGREVGLEPAWPRGGTAHPHVASLVGTREERGHPVFP